MSRGRRQMYSSGEDSWEDEKWSHQGHQRRQRLEVPGSRSRSSSHSMSPRRLRPASSGRRSPGTRSHKAPSTPRKASPRKSPSPHSEKGRKSPNPFGSPVGRRRPSGRSRHDDHDDYQERRSPRRHSPEYERRGRRSFTPEDYRRGRRSQTSKYEDEDRWEGSPHYEDKYKYRKHYKYDETETESPVEEPRRKKSSKSKKESKNEETDFAALIEKTMSKAKEKAPEQEKIQESVGQIGPEQSENEYENFSPAGENKGIFLEESNSPNLQLGMNMNTPAENVTQHQEAKMSAASVAETIIVQPAEERLYTSQFRLETDNNLLTTKVPEDDGDSGIGFTIGDLNADFSQSYSLKKQGAVFEAEPEHYESPPKQWTLFSFSPSGPLKVRDEETGEVFTVINEIPIESTEEKDNMESHHKEEDDEDDVGWCSMYLLIRVFGLFVLIAGLAGMVLYSVTVK